jgi:hypothetical protein
VKLNRRRDANTLLLLCVPASPLAARGDETNICRRIGGAQVSDTLDSLARASSDGIKRTRRLQNKIHHRKAVDTCALLGLGISSARRPRLTNTRRQYSRGYNGLSVSRKGKKPVTAKESSLWQCTLLAGLESEHTVEGHQRVQTSSSYPKRLVKSCTVDRTKSCGEVSNSLTNKGVAFSRTVTCNAPVQNKNCPSLARNKSKRAILETAHMAADALSHRSPPQSQRYIECNYAEPVPRLRQSHQESLLIISTARDDRSQSSSSIPFRDEQMGKSYNAIVGGLTAFTLETKDAPLKPITQPKANGHSNRKSGLGCRKPKQMVSSHQNDTRQIESCNGHEDIQLHFPVAATSPVRAGRFSEQEIAADDCVVSQLADNLQQCNIDPTPQKSIGSGTPHHNAGFAKCVPCSSKRLVAFSPIYNQKRRDTKKTPASKMMLLGIPLIVNFEYDRVKQSDDDDAASSLSDESALERSEFDLKLASVDKSTEPADMYVNEADIACFSEELQSAASSIHAQDVEPISGEQKAAIECQNQSRDEVSLGGGTEQLPRRTRRRRKQTDFFHKIHALNDENHLNELAILSKEDLGDVDLGVPFIDGSENCSKADHPYSSEDSDEGPDSLHSETDTSHKLCDSQSSVCRDQSGTIDPNVPLESGPRRVRRLKRYPAVPKLTASTKMPDGWSAAQLKQLVEAHRSVDPVSCTYWLDIASKVDGKTAGECRMQWYSSVLTPAAKPSKRNTSKNLLVEGDDDDIFNSTPMRGFLPGGTAIAARTRVASLLPPTNEKENMDQNSLRIEQPSPQKPLYKSFLQRMKREVARVENEARSKKVAPRAWNKAKSISEVVYDHGLDVKVQLTPGGTLKVRRQVVDKEDDFWSDQSDSEVNDGY